MFEVVLRKPKDEAWAPDVVLERPTAVASVLEAVLLYPKAED